MFALRRSSSPAPSKRASQIDWGEIPRFSSSTTCWLASFSEPLRRVESRSVEATASGLPADQPSRDPRRAGLVLPPGAIGRLVAVGRVPLLVLQQGVGQRPEDRLGVLPADALERPPTVGHVDRLVADVAEVAAPIADEELVDFVGPGRPGQAGDRRVGGRLVPVVHRRDERLRRPGGGTAVSSTGAIVQFPSRTSAACELLK